MYIVCLLAVWSFNIKFMYILCIVTYMKEHHLMILQCMAYIEDYHIHMIFHTLLIHYTAIITTQPRDVTVCTGVVVVFTCVVDRNGTDITSDDVMWQMIRMSGGISTLSTSLTGGVPFNITTTISGDILTSTLTVTGVTDSNLLQTSLYRCVVNDMMSRNASLYISTGTNCLSMCTLELGSIEI